LSSGAREMLAHARWRAEREFPAQWGEHKLNIYVVGPVTMSEALDTVAGELFRSSNIKSSS